MATKSAYHRDYRMYRCHYSQPWVFLSLDLYSRTSHNCNRYMHCMNHLNGSFEAMLSHRLLDIFLIMLSLYPKELNSSQKDSLPHKKQAGIRFLEPNRYKKKTNHVLWERNQKLKKPILELWKKEDLLHELLALFLCVMKVVFHLLKKLIRDFCVYSP